MPKTITLLGSTGSIGTQSLDVARMQGYRVLGLAANRRLDVLLPQIAEFHPRYVAVVDLTRAGNLIRNNTYDAVNPLMIVALSYLAMVIFLTYVLKGFERRLNKDKH